MENLSESIRESIDSATKHLGDSDRKKDIEQGIVAALLINAGDSGATVMQALINSGELLSDQLPTKDFFDDYLYSKSKIEEYFSSHSTYKDSYYLGKSIGDIVGAGVGVGITVKSILEMLEGASAVGAGVAASGTGLGVSLISAGTAITAAGIADGAVGTSMAFASIGNFGDDFRKFKYYDKLDCISASGTGKNDKGFKTFSDAKKYLGSPGKDKQWHHIVEQSQIKKSGFSPTQIHNTDNLIAIDKATHAKISGYYNSIQPDFSGSMRVRDWLAGQSFETQYKLGMDILKGFGVVK